MYLACWSRIRDVLAVPGDTVVANGVADVVMEGFTVHNFIFWNNDYSWKCFIMYMKWVYWTEYNAHF